MREARAAPSAPSDRPLRPADLAWRLDRLGPFEPDPAVAVAVSGGPDSLALALLSRPWVERRGGSLLALVVDHRLRADSSGEARLTCVRLEGAGIACRILTWTGPKPPTGIMAAARRARYDLLEAECREAGILHLLLAHHRDDQTETLVMRREMGSGPLGMAGMSAVVHRPHVRLLRPLLDVSKDRLVRTVQAAGLPWVDDDANRDPRYWRGRFRLQGARRIGPLLPRASERTRLERALADLLAEHAEIHPLCHLALPVTAFLAADHALRRLFLGRTLLCLGGSTHPPAPARLDALAGTLADPAGKGWHSLGGCLVARDGGRLRVAREPGRIRHRLALPPGEPVRWDNRFVIETREIGLAAVPAGPGRWPRLPGLPAWFPRTLPLITALDRPVQLGSWSLRRNQVAAHVRLHPKAALLNEAFENVAVASRNV